MCLMRIALFIARLGLTTSVWVAMHQCITTTGHHVSRCSSIPRVGSTVSTADILQCRLQLMASLTKQLLVELFKILIKVGRWHGCWLLVSATRIIGTSSSGLHYRHASQSGAKKSKWSQWIEHATCCSYTGKERKEVAIPGRAGHQRVKKIPRQMRQRGHHRVGKEAVVVSWQFVRVRFHFVV